MKIVINECFGGFSLSPEADLWLYNNGYDGKGFKENIEHYFSSDYRCSKALEIWESYLNTGKYSIVLNVFTPDKKHVLYSRDIDRTHPLLIKCIEELGEKANGACAELKIIEIPNNIEYEIEDYDGIEHIAEIHRTWS